MRKILMSAVAAAVLVVLLASAQGTAALWRGEDQLNPGTIKTGTLSLEAGDGTSAAQDFEFVGLDTTTLAPGGFVQAPLTISNTGTTGQGYRLAGAASTTTPPRAADAELAAAVELSVHAVANAAACPEKTAAVGTQLYKGTLAGAVFAQARELIAANSEVLCIRVALPANAPQAAAAGKMQLVLSWRGDQL